MDEPKLIFFYTVALIDLRDVHEGGYFLVQTIPREIICSEDWGYLFAIRLTALSPFKRVRLIGLCYIQTKK